MNELDREARALIDRARGAEDATLADRARVKRRIAAALGATAIAATAREAMDSGVQTSSTPLPDTASGGVVERISGEVLRAAPVVKTAGAIGGVSTMFVQAAALLLGGALAGGAAWLALDGGSERAATARTTELSAQAASPIGASKDSAPLAASGATEERAPAPPGDGAALVPQPEPLNVEAPVQLEDLPVLESEGERPAKKNRARRVSPRRMAALASERAGTSLADEARDLAEVHEALRQGNHAIALSRLDAMDRRSGGVLGEERSVARVLSLCGLGRVGEAEAIARRVASVAPESPLLPRLRGSCAKGALTQEEP